MYAQHMLDINLDEDDEFIVAEGHVPDAREDEFLHLLRVRVDVEHWRDEGGEDGAFVLATFSYLNSLGHNAVVVDRAVDVREMPRTIVKAITEALSSI